MNQAALRASLAVALLSLLAASVPAPTYEVYAIRFATLKGFPASGLIAGADRNRKLDVAMMVWLLEGSDGRKVLVDAGFYHQKFLNQWKPQEYMRPSDALAAVGVRPEDVSDIVLSHVHWDHADGLDLFPKARIWIQRAEYEYYVDPSGKALDRAIDSTVALGLHQAQRGGRLQLVDGDAREIIPGITVYTGGRHTYASQYVGVNTAAGTVVVASDNAYTYENLSRHVPIAQTFDSSSNRQAMERMATLAASARLIVPGHDPEVFVRFPTPGKGVARIQ